MEKHIKTLVMITIIATLTSLKVNAQFNIGGPGTSGSGTNANGTSGSPSVPFDGGMSLILAASGISYAAKKLKREVLRKKA